MNTILNKQGPEQYLRGLLILLLFCQAPLLFAQSGQDQNMVKATTVLKEGITTTGQVSALPFTDRVIETQYMDGFGRPWQKVSQQASPGGYDVIQAFEYDERGHHSKTYLPYVTTANDGGYRDNWPGEQAAFYQTNNDRIANTAYPWSESRSEHAPLDRVLEQGAPGQEWQLGNHTIRTRYETNGTDEVIRWGVSNGHELIDEGYYPAGALTVNVVVNESGHQIREYANKKGETLLKKTEGDNGEWLETYYVHDAFSNLRFVLPPMLMGSASVVPSGECGPEQYIATTTTLTSYQGQSYRIAEGVSLKLSYNNQESFRFSYTDGCFYMRREGGTSQTASENQQTQSNLPIQKIRINTSLTSFEGFSYLVEKGNELTLSPPEGSELILNTSSTPSFYARVAELGTPGVDNIDPYAYQYQYDEQQHMIAKKMPGTGWIYYVHDAWDRLILTQSENQRMKNPQEWSFTKYDALSRPVLTGIYRDIQNRSREAIQQAALAPGNLRYEERNNSTHGYTLNHSFPQDLTANDVLTVSYYDDYGFSFASNTPYSFQPELGNTTYLSRVKGKPTGSKTKILDVSEQWMNEVLYYDDEERTIQVVADNQIGGFDRMSSRYSFDGKVLETHLTHQNPLAPTGQQELRINNSYNYDHTGRKTRSYQQINGGQEILVADHQYNELGEPVEKNLHSQDNGLSFLQSIDYRYNIRGWLTHINNTDLTNDGIYNDDDNDLFGMELRYTEANAALEGNPQYNGNVAEIQWNDAYHQRKRGYGFQYDTYGRLTRAHYADYQTGANAWSEHIGDFDLSGLSYDKNGNILYLQRNGYRSNATFGIMDQLNYSYEGNQLLAVTDQAAAQGYNDFQDRGATGNTDYNYDGNGNLTGDANKGIVQIDYNHLSLPNRIDMGGGNEIHYLYDAGGNKLKKIVKQNGQPDQNTWYIGTMVYNDNGLDFILSDEGRVVPNGSGSFRYEYHYKDYLDNTRLAFSDLDGNGSVDNSEILQVEHYYPFGMDFYGLNTPQTGPEHKFLYNGIERQDDFGLATYMADFRMLDPALARWWQIDPKTENQYSFSPYLAIHNNPVRFNDPKGDIAPAVWAAIVYAVENAGETAIDVALGVTLTYLTGIPYTGWDVAADYLSNLIPGLGETKTAKKVTDIGIALAKVKQKFSKIPGADKTFKQVNKYLNNIKNGTARMQSLQNLKGALYEFRLINSLDNVIGAERNARQLANLGGLSKQAGDELNRRFGDVSIDVVQKMKDGTLNFIEAKTGDKFSRAWTLESLQDKMGQITKKIDFAKEFNDMGGKSVVKFHFSVPLRDEFKESIINYALQSGVNVKIILD